MYKNESLSKIPEYLIKNTFAIFGGRASTINSLLVHHRLLIYHIAITKSIIGKVYYYYYIFFYHNLIFFTYVFS